MQDLLKIVKSLEDSGILLNGITETVKNEVKEQKGGFLSVLLGTFGASLLGDLLTKNLSGRGVIRAGEGTIRAGYGGTLRASLLGDLLTKNLSGRGVIRAGEGTVRAGYGSKKF